MNHMLLSLVVAGLAGGGELSADDFRFVVIGDTRPKFESEDFRVFEGLIGRINQRRPALVINLGDLIYGYGLLSKEKQWDKYQQTIQAFAVPYHQLPGKSRPLLAEGASHLRTAFRAVLRVIRPRRRSLRPAQQLRGGAVG